jgi:hypothetical protein
MTQNTTTFEAVADDFQDMIRIHQYYAGSQILIERRNLLLQFWPHFDTITALTKHARYRLNFNFSDAEKALEQIGTDLPADITQRIRTLHDQIKERDTVWVLAEEIFTAEMEMSIGDYKDTLTAIVTFREGLMRHYITLLGVKLNDTRSRMDKRWFNKQHKLKAALKGSGVGAGSLLMPATLNTILQYYAQHNKQVRQICKRLKKFDAIADLRNASIHHHAGVSRPTIADAYSGGIQKMIDDLYALYTDVTGKQIEINPYQEVNSIILILAGDLYAKEK